MLLLRTDDLLFFSADMPCGMCAPVLPVCGSADVRAADGAKRAGLRMRAVRTDRRLSLSDVLARAFSTFPLDSISPGKKLLRIRLAAGSRLIGGGLHDSIMDTATLQSERRDV